jgi:hypothetical protein
MEGKGLDICRCHGLGVRSERICCPLVYTRGSFARGIAGGSVQARVPWFAERPARPEGQAGGSQPRLTQARAGKTPMRTSKRITADMQDGYAITDPCKPARIRKGSQESVRIGANRRASATSREYWCELVRPACRQAAGQHVRRPAGTGGARRREVTRRSSGEQAMATAAWRR